MEKKKIGVVIHRDLLPQLFEDDMIEALNALGEVKWTDSQTPIDIPAAIELLRDCEVGIGGWGTPMPCEELLAACPQLKLWINAAGSVRRMFGPHLEGRDFMIATCRESLGANVAEYSLGCLIMGLRRAWELALANRRQPTGRPPNIMALNVATVGIVGASAIGRQVIALLKQAGSRVLLYDPFVSAEDSQAMGAEKYEDLVALCAESHAVSLHAPALPSTEKMMGAKHFQAMRDDCVFVNTARGMCVDEEALVAELSKGRLMAYLDVTYPEPPVADSPLRQLDNVFYTPHIAGFSVLNLGRQVVRDVKTYVEGGMPSDVVRPEMLDRIA